MTTTKVPPSYGAEVAERLAHVCAGLAGVPDLGMVCGQVLPLLVMASGAKRASIMLINPDNGRLRIAASVGLPIEVDGQDLPREPRSISEWVAQRQRPVIVNGAVTEANFEGRDETIETALSIPIDGLDGPVGVVNLARFVPGKPFDQAEMIAVASLCHPIGLAIERIRRAMLGGRCLSELQAPAGAWVNTMLREGSTAAHKFQFGLARFSGAREAGDMCVRVPHANGSQTLMALDCSATGVASATISAFTHGMLVASATPERSAVALVARLNAALHARLGSGHHVALWLGQLSGSGQLSYCNAGMAPPLWVPADDNPPRPLDVGGPVAGALAQADFREETLRLLPGDMVVGASNGVLFAEDSSGRSFGEKRLANLATEFRHQPPDRVARAVCEAARSFSTRTMPPDDLTVFALRYTTGN